MYRVRMTGYLHNLEILNRERYFFGLRFPMEIPTPVFFTTPALSLFVPLSLPAGMDPYLCTLSTPGRIQKTCNALVYYSQLYTLWNVAHAFLAENSLELE